MKALEVSSSFLQSLVIGDVKENVPKANSATPEAQKEEHTSDFSFWFQTIFSVTGLPYLTMLSIFHFILLGKQYAKKALTILKICPKLLQWDICQPLIRCLIKMKNL